jgi:hypothetical protein
MPTVAAYGWRQDLSIILRFVGLFSRMAPFVAGA